ncbi:ABC transporter [Kytococcus sp. CUA-901]|nr:ABC transporter [Kytococcus sp. CUA-901]
MTAPTETVSDTAALTYDELTVRFRTETGDVLAVDGVSMSVAPGEIVGVVGESGCGKSVSSMAAGGLLPRSAQVEGAARLHGRDLVGASTKELRRIRGRQLAYIFQEPMNSLNPVMRVGDQIVETLRIHTSASRREARQRAINLLKLVRIPSAEIRARQYPHQLSGGMRQRVMIAMAVACEPDVLIADEPTTALDVTVQAGIIDLLADLRERLGTSIVLITHDLGVIADVADRVVVMYAGRVVEEGPVDEIFHRPAHRYTRALLDTSQPARADEEGPPRLAEIPGLVPVMRDSPDACTFAERCPAATEQCRTSRPLWESLEVPSHHVACWHPVGREEKL